MIIKSRGIYFAEYYGGGEGWLLKKQNENGGLGKTLSKCIIYTPE